MKKAVLILVTLIACLFLVGNADTIAKFGATVAQGAVIPLVIAIILMLARHIIQALSYMKSFEAVGFYKTTLWSNTVLIFSLVFINTFCMFGGATGVAFIIDDAHRKGADMGKATSGAFLSQIGYFAAVLVISIIGFLAMVISGQINWLVIVGSLAMMCVLLGLSSMFIVGYYLPNVLHALFRIVGKVINEVLSIAKKSLAEDWAYSTAENMISNARILAHNPAGTARAIAWASCSAILNMLCLVAVGFAFGFTGVPILIAAFALAAVSVILSPTPQGVGVVEAAIAALVTGGGGTLATATAIALVYRGVMFWIPFCIGALLLSQSDFFSGKNKKPEEASRQKEKDVGWVTGTLVGILGLVNIGLVFLPNIFVPYEALVSWISFGNVFVGPTLAIAGFALLLLGCGLVFRFRICWTGTTTLLVLVACCEFLFHATVSVAIVTMALVLWMLWRRDYFTRPLSSFKRPKFFGTKMEAAVAGEGEGSVHQGAAAVVHEPGHDPASNRVSPDTAAAMSEPKVVGADACHAGETSHEASSVGASAHSAAPSGQSASAEEPSSAEPSSAIKA